MTLPLRTPHACTPSLELIPAITIFTLEKAVPAVFQAFASRLVTELTAASFGVTAVLERELVHIVACLC
jgi:hypothetical protein